jgi:hypothetical protein
VLTEDLAMFEETDEESEQESFVETALIWIAFLPLIIFGGLAIIGVVSLLLGHDPSDWGIFD